MLKLFTITVFCLSQFHILNAQNMERVQRNINTLCAPEFYGRGASFDGQKKAANFLADCFKETGLLPLTNSYFQPFNYSINTFPGDLVLKLDKDSIVAGKEYIIRPNSPSIKGKYKIIEIDSLYFSSSKNILRFQKIDLRKYALVYDDTFVKKINTLPKALSDKIKNAPLLIELKEKKLTMGLSTNQSNTTVIELKKECYRKKTKRITIEIDAIFIDNYQAQNVCGYIKGISNPDSFLFITAHYDHLGSLGKNNYFPGANDNGSGVSMLLELASYYKQNPPPYSIAFIAFGAEEAGLIGSKYFTENPLVPLSKIYFLINLDLMGTGDDGLMVVNGTIFNAEFDLLKKLNNEKGYLPEIKKRGKAANSDHYYFTEKGVPAFFLYTLGGITAYHDIYDIPQTLPLTKYREVYQLLTNFVNTLQH